MSPLLVLSRAFLRDASIRCERVWKRGFVNEKIFVRKCVCCEGIFDIQGNPDPKAKTAGLLSIPRERCERALERSHALLKQANFDHSALQQGANPC